MITITVYLDEHFVGHETGSTGNWVETGTPVWSVPGEVKLTGTTGKITNTSDTRTLYGTVHTIVFQSDSTTPTDVVLDYNVGNGAIGCHIILVENDTGTINGVTLTNGYTFVANTDITMKVIIDDNGTINVYFDDETTSSLTTALASTTDDKYELLSTTSAINITYKSLVIKEPSAKTINESFRGICKLTTTEVTDLELESSFIPKAFELYNAACDDDKTIEDYTAGNVIMGDLTHITELTVVDSIIACFAAYFAYKDEKWNKVDKEENFYYYQKFWYDALDLISAIYPSGVEFIKSLDKYILISAGIKKAYMGFTIQDNTDVTIDHEEL